MRELERISLSSSQPAFTPPKRVAVIGAGRLGTTLAAALNLAGIAVAGPYGHGVDPAAQDPVETAVDVVPDVVLLCVPDSEIAAAASVVSPGPLVGHCSGATSLSVLSPHEGFSMHPLMTVTAEDDPARLRGAGAAIDGDTPRALAVAGGLAEALGMRPVRVADADRAAYHAAASMASNFLVTLEAAAERLAATAGVERSLLVPLVQAAVENWAQLGPERALTGPVARGDEETVARQRAAVGERVPELVALYDALVQATRRLAETEAVIA